MHVALLTVLIVTGAGQPLPEPVEPPMAAVAPAAEGGPCDACPAVPVAPVEEGVYAGVRKAVCDWFGPMPQTCYGSRFGCYPGNNGRDIHRYPAFHGYYYREPYNYRHYFEYPWHAQPHEPQPYAGYRGPAIEGSLLPTPDPGMSAPVPQPAPMPLEEPQARAQTFGKTRLLGR